MVEFDAGDIEPLVVVNALPCADSTLLVNITYSRFFLDNKEFKPVEGASVEIETGGTTLVPTHRTGANYMFNYRIAGGDSLTMHVNIDGYDEIYSATRVPYNPPIDSLKFEIDTLTPFTSGEISFTLNDDASLRNYYLIYIMERDSGSRWNSWETRWDTIDTVVHATFNCMDLSICDQSVNLSTGLLGYFGSLLFTDSLINGQNHSVLITIPMFKDTAEHPIQRDYTLVVESLSHEAFRYRAAVSKASSLTQYFAEPEKIYSNINGALGIMAGISKRTIPITFTYKEAVQDSTARRRHFFQKRM